MKILEHKVKRYPSCNKIRPANYLYNGWMCSTTNIKLQASGHALGRIIVTGQQDPSPPIPKLTE
jgi:hypothetical protein